MIRYTRLVVYDRDSAELLMELEWDSINGFSITSVTESLRPLIERWVLTGLSDGYCERVVIPATDPTFIKMVEDRLTSQAPFTTRFYELEFLNGCPFSSHGCRRCCSYGSKEQQKEQAELLAKAIDGKQ